MIQLLLFRCSVSVQLRFEHGCFAASAQTMRQLSLQIESVYGLVSNLLSCLGGFCFRSVQGNLWVHTLSNSLRNSPTSAYNGVPTPGPLITHGLALLSLNTAWVDR